MPVEDDEEGEEEVEVEDTGPRLFLTEDHRPFFGSVRSAQWEPASVGDPAERSAAYRQHLLACAVRDARRASKPIMTVKQLAESIYMTPEVLGRKLRGTRWINWRDASALALAFPNRKIIPDPDELLPPK